MYELGIVFVVLAILAVFTIDIIEIAIGVKIVTLLIQIRNMK